MEYISIELESDMCVSNGESSGNAVDSDICTDVYGIPYIPARRIKGCLRQAAEMLMKAGYPIATQERIDSLFGNAFGTEGSFYLSDGMMEEHEQIRKWLDNVKESGSNALLKMMAHPTSIKQLFTDVRGQARMKDGAKVDNTLRFTRVLNQYNPLNEKPHVFYAPVTRNDMDPDIHQVLIISTG